MLMKKVEVLRAACCVAGVDGEVTEREQILIQRLADETGVGKVSLNAMIQRGQTDPSFYQEQFRILKADPDQAMQLLFMVACADGELKTQEREVLYHLAVALEMSDKRFNQWLAAAHKKVQKNDSV